MRFQIEQRDLLMGIQRVIGVIEKRNTLPILHHVILTAQTLPSGENPSEVSLFATDLEMGVRDAYPANILVPGQITYPARKLLEIARSLPEGIVDIEEQESYLILIKSGGALFKVSGLPPDQFPAFPPPDEGSTHEIQVTFSPSVLARLIRKTVFAAGGDHTRYILNGILVQIRRVTGEKSMIRLVATDGHRLLIAEDAISTDYEGPEEENFIVPKKGMLEIKRLLEDILSRPQQEEIEDPLKITLTKSMLTVHHKKGVLICRLLHGSYPKYQQVIPQECDKKVEANRASVIGAITRASVLSEERMSVVSMTVQTGQILLSSKSSDFGEASEGVSTSYCGSTLPLRFVAHDLRELLSVIDDDEIVFEFKDDQSSCMIREKSGRGIFVFAPSID